MKAAKEFIGELAEQISMPVVYRDIRQLIAKQDLNLNDFVTAIENDSMLSIRLMRIAHSLYFGFPQGAGNLYQALNQMGVMQLHDLVLNSLSLRAFTAVPQQIFNLQAFWQYSVECGIAARTIAQYARIFPINPYFTLGLLHEIGHAAMYIKAPGLSLQAFHESAETGNALVERETALLGFDYTQAGTELMQLWRLPELHQQVTSFHLTPDKAGKNYQQAVKIVHLAHMLCQDQGVEVNREAIEQLSRDDIELQNLPASIDAIVHQEIAENTDTVLAMLWPDYAPQ